MTAKSTSERNYRDEMKRWLSQSNGLVEAPTRVQTALLGNGAAKKRARNTTAAETVIDPCSEPTGVHCASTVAPADVYPCSVIRPAFRGQAIVDTVGAVDLDADNKLILVHDLLAPSELGTFIASAVAVPRYTGKSAHNSVKPRREVCYTVDGMPFFYSGRKHPTVKFPAHVTDLFLPRCAEALARYIPENRFQKLSNGIDILYGPEFARGGSIGAHSDDEMKWGLVVIYSLGQTRWLRLRSKVDGTWTNVEARHNSLIAMYGDTFQSRYTHQIDKLSRTEPVHHRLSLNVRFLSDVEDTAN
jgi:alkylated DNA repair dioxygenase AlkB